MENSNDFDKLWCDFYTNFKNQRNSKSPFKKDKSNMKDKWDLLGKDIILKKGAILSQSPQKAKLAFAFNNYITKPTKEDSLINRISETYKSVFHPQHNIKSKEDITSEVKALLFHNTSLNTSQNKINDLLNQSPIKRSETNTSINRKLTRSKSDFSIMLNSNTQNLNSTNVDISWNTSINKSLFTSQQSLNTNHKKIFKSNTLFNKTPNNNDNMFNNNSNNKTKVVNINSWMNSFKIEMGQMFKRGVNNNSKNNNNYNDNSSYLFSKSSSMKMLNKTSNRHNSISISNSNNIGFLTNSMLRKSYNEEKRNKYSKDLLERYEKGGYSFLGDSGNKKDKERVNEKWRWFKKKMELHGV